MQRPSVGVSLKREGDVLLLQPFQPTSENVETLTVDLRESRNEVKTMPWYTRGCTVVPGIMGVMKLSRISVLITIDEAKQVATLHGHPVFKVIETNMHLPYGEIPPEDKEYVSLLKSAVDPKQFGRGQFFSYGANLTLTTERAAAVKEDGVDASWEVEDPRFFWNKHLATPITRMRAHAFMLPVIQGFVSELRDLDFTKAGGDAVTANIVLIARRSVKRLGTRNWRRGADREGSVANFVETEQLLSFSTGQTCSFIQLRGSIPVFWTSIPNVKYKPPTKVGREADYTHAFESHIEDLLHTYRECVAVNLAHATGSEGSLTSAFDTATRRFSRNKEGFRLINFDFHKECGTTRYHRLSILFDQIKADLERFGQFTTADGRVESVQKGVIRTNCVDCLDRTNVVQTVFGRNALESFLRSLDLLQGSGSLPSAFPEIENQFKIIWADHGDEVSLQYSGTGALKSGFTRTGKRSVGGLIDDGVKSVKRYYLNNFEDGRKQDALDLVSGAFVVGQDTAGHDLQRSPDILIYTILLFSVYGLVKFFEGLAGMTIGREQAAHTLFTAFACLVIAAIVGQFVMIKNGTQLICKPRLRPDLPKPW